MDLNVDSYHMVERSGFGNGVFFGFTVFLYFK